MDRDEHERLQRHVCDVMLRHCALCREDGYMVKPPDVWRGGRCKRPAVALARACVGLTLRCTIGRDVGLVAPWPWTIFPEGIPLDGNHERFSLPLIGQYVGGDHTTFLQAIVRLKHGHSQIWDAICDTYAEKPARGIALSDSYATELAKDVTFYVAMDEIWKRQEAAANSQPSSQACPIAGDFLD